MCHILVTPVVEDFSFILTLTMEIDLITHTRNTSSGARRVQHFKKNDADTSCPLQN